MEIKKKKDFTVSRFPITFISVGGDLGQLVSSTKGVAENAGEERSPVHPRLNGIARTKCDILHSCTSSGYLWHRSLLC